jgi:hypothetical protein
MLARSRTPNASVGAIPLNIVRNTHKHNQP